MNLDRHVPAALRQASSELQRINPDYHAVPFYSETWRRQFPDDADLEAVLDRYPSTITRKQIADFAYTAQSRDSHTLRQLMFGVMLWGFGTIGYGAYRTSRMLGHPNSVQLLADTVQHVTNGELRNAYEGFDLPMCGAAYFTKLFYFVGLGCSVRPLPLILDSVVANSLERYLRCDISAFAVVSRDDKGKIVYVDRWTSGYTRYVEQMNTWAHSLHCRADSLELFLFQQEYRDVMIINRPAQGSPVPAAPSVYSSKPMGGIMATEVTWDRVKKLEGKTLTTIRGKRFQVRQVTDTDVYYDPLDTRSPGTHWTRRDTITRLSNAIQNMKNKPSEWLLKDIEGLCQEHSIKGEEQTYSYILPILCAIGVIQHRTAGQIR